MKFAFIRPTEKRFIFWKPHFGPKSKFLLNTSGLVIPLILVLLLCTTQLMVHRAWFYTFFHTM